MYGVMTVAREVADRRHMIAKKPVTVRMMPIGRPSGLDTATGKLAAISTSVPVFFFYFFFQPSL